MDAVSLPSSSDCAELPPARESGRMSRSQFSLSLLFSSLACAVIAGASERPTRSTAAGVAYRQFREFHLGANDAVAQRDPAEPAPDSARSLELARALGSDGRWADIDYASTANSGWPPENHCTRLLAIAATAGQRGTAASDRATLLAAAHRAFAFWVAHDFQCPNWWYNEIGIPKTLGAAALLLGDELAPEEFRYVAEVLLARFPIARTGQNKVWLAGNTLMRGLLAGDEAAIGAAAAVIWAQVNVSVEEGVQPDFSFHQHGAQLQFGNYGMAFAVETARWSEILRGTPWQIPPEKLAVFRSYLLDGQNWISWRGAMDISSCGRQLLPHSPRLKTATIARVMTQAASFDPAQSAAYAAFLARNLPEAANDLVGNRYFWRSDYLVHRRPEFVATLKLSSTRVIGAEMVNRENLSGYHNADGALLLYRRGGEYEEIFPLWDWRKLPGVTCAQAALPEFKTASVDRDFVGGVSDGADGLAALDYVRDGVSARKAWFFAGDTLVCLGADISNSGSASVATTINQCLLHGPVRVTARGATERIAAGNHSLHEVEAVEHDGWRYTLLEPATLHLDAGAVTGNWRKVFDNPETPAADVTADLFTLWLDHGSEPRAAHYAYSIAPPASEAQPRVLANSAAIQAVEMPGGKVGVVFWSAGELRLPDGRRIAVDAPCLVLAAADAIRVVDPTQKLPAIHLQIDGQEHALALPTGALAGTAAVVN